MSSDEEESFQMWEERNEKLAKKNKLAHSAASLAYLSVLGGTGMQRAGEPYFSLSKGHAANAKKKRKRKKARVARKRNRK